MDIVMQVQNLLLSVDAYKIQEFILACKKSDDIMMQKAFEVIKDKGLDIIKEADNPVILEIKLK